MSHSHFALAFPLKAQVDSQALTEHLSSLMPALSRQPIGLAPFHTVGRRTLTRLVGRVVKIGGKLSVNFAPGAYCNVVRPEFVATGQFRTQITFIFLIIAGVGCFTRHEIQIRRRGNSRC
jgi:hypothetical protein